jgi:beta-ketodecanoyl-[acyl-carrier-protein] synthase
MKIVISGTGLFTPAEKISNEELVNCFNKDVENYNFANKAAIEAGELEARLESSSAFIEKASGIKSRYVMNKSGILDINIMHPVFEKRAEDEISYQCEMALAAAKEAMRQANKTAADIDFIIVSASNMQRGYPAIAIELQAALGAEGYGYDMNVACSSATFGIQSAANAIYAGTAKVVLMVNPEMCTSQVDFRNRSNHFIFGDACTAVIIETSDTATSDFQYEIIDCKLKTIYSKNIYNNMGFINRCEVGNNKLTENLFTQDGRRVFKAVTPLVAATILEHLDKNEIQANDLKKLWLHQANSNMNRLIATKILGHEPSDDEAPIVLDEYANTSSAGSIIVFHKTKYEVEPGHYGVLCSFGGGYSVGNIILKRIK